MSNETSPKKTDPNHDDSAAPDQYDRGIVPAETAARKEREGGEYKHSLHEEKADPDSVETTGGYTIDKEGLANNFAVEPEMYINEPGDLRQDEDEDAAERAQEVAEVNETDETGKLTDHGDKRGKGPGVI
ncbi:hypothetical protein IQ268_06340 [Oculatella sp. LEGE 06141]|uniref:hypothetical protein n=1 Tax=Oculatella sp. LEGE 06141 TaxID=1828648 RepID=UPI0018811203|nr:hypothetical protein [Oculatella sp. LEGE 06141]MBE9178203.1 hypothetical protein [Oculatella sp. LEGE 06141]